MNVFLRKKGLGLSSIRGIIASMSHYARIARVDIPRQPIPMASQGDIAFNWGTMASPRGYTVFNSPESILKTSNKGQFRKLLYDNGLTMHTILNYNDEILPETKYVLRPANHKGGRDIRIATEHDMRYKWYSGGYASVYIPKVAEYRVFVAQNRVVYISQKFVEDESDIAWNVEQGGRFENLRRGSWNKSLVEKSLKAVALGGLHFGAVDVILDRDGNYYVLEVNTAPALSGEYWISCIAKSFDYMIETRGEILPDAPFDDSYNWRYVLHPSLEGAETYQEPVNEYTYEYSDLLENHMDVIKEIIADDNVISNDISGTTFTIQVNDTLKYKIKCDVDTENMKYILNIVGVLELKWVETESNETGV